MDFKKLTGLQELHGKINQKTFHSFVLKINPDVARYILDNYNIGTNRSISSEKAEYYANTMIANQWIIGDSLKFDIEGMLCDGQHRLKAVVLSDVPTEFLITVGYEPKSAQVFDRGKPRSLTDIAALQGDSWINSTHYSTFRGMLLALTDSSNNINKKPDAYRIQCMNQLKEGIFFATNKSNNKNALKCGAFRGTIARAYYADQIIDKKVLSDFVLYFHGFNPMEQGELFSQNHSQYKPAIVIRLREFYLAGNWSRYGDLQGGRGLSQTKSYLVQNALHHYIEQTGVKNLALSAKNWFPSKLIDSMI